MSIEDVLSVLFVLWLLFHLLRLAMQKSQPRQQPEATARVARPQPANVGPAEAPVTPVPEAVPEVPEVAAAKRYLAQERTAQRKRGEGRVAATGEPAVPTEAEQNARDQRDVLRSVRSPGGVRKALVAMTVLGPCRAMEPYDWGEAGRPHR